MIKTRLLLISLLLSSVLFTASVPINQSGASPIAIDSPRIERTLPITSNRMPSSMPAVEGLKSGYFVESDATGPYDEPGMECYLGFSRVAAFTATGIYLIGSEGVAYSEFIGSTGSEPAGISELPTLFTDLSSSRAGLPTYSSICYDDLWPGIDLTYRIAPEGLKYEYSLSSRAQPEWLGLSLEGQDVSLADDGRTLIVNGIEDAELIAWQGDGRKIDVRFWLEEDVVGFNVLEEYEGGLVIDPLVYSTFLGGYNPDEAVDVTVDENGSAYVTGWTVSSDFPTVPGSFDETFNGLDAFVCKFLPDGSAMEYCTFYGLSGTTTIPLAIDHINGSAIIVGGTDADIPVTGNALYGTFRGGASDAFLLRLCPNGTTLEFSTYFGGNDDDTGFGIISDSNGDIYATGQTLSSDLPVTTGAFQSSKSSLEDVFVIKVSGDGTTLVNCTYFGGTNKDVAESIAVDENGTAHIVGWTKSSDLPMTANSANGTFGGDVDAFLFRLCPNATSLEYSTFLGGAKREFGYDVAVGENGTAFVTGSTKSPEFPVTDDAFQSDLNNDPAIETYDAFYSKVHPNGTLIYSTFLGDSDFDEGRSIAIDENGSAYIAGMTECVDFPVVFGSYDVSFGGGQDAYMVKFSESGTTLLYGTFLGNSGDESAKGVCVDENGSVYLTGFTESPNFPTTASAFDESHNGGPEDAFVTVLGNISALAWPNIRLLSATTLADISEYFTVFANVTDERPGGAGISWVNVTFDGIEYVMENTSTSEAWNWTASLRMNTTHAARLIYWNVWGGVADGFTNSTGSYNISVGDFPNILNVSASSRKTQDSTWRITAVVSDDLLGDSGVSSVQVFFGDQYYDMVSASEDYAWSHTLTETGTFDWHVIVTDSAGNSNTSLTYTLRVRGAPGVSVEEPEAAEEEEVAPSLPEAPSLLWSVGWYLWVLLMAALTVLSAWGYTSTKTRPAHWKAFLGFSIMFSVVGGAVMGLMGALSWLLTVGVWALVGGASFFVASYKMNQKIRNVLSVRWVGAVVFIVLAGVLATLGLVGVI